MSESEPKSTLSAALAAIQASVSSETEADDAALAAAAAADDGAAAACAEVSTAAASPPVSRRDSAKGEKLAASGSSQKKGRPAGGSDEKENEQAVDDHEGSSAPGTPGEGDPQEGGSADPPAGSSFLAALHAFVTEGSKVAPECASWDEGTTRGAPGWPVCGASLPRNLTTLLENFCCVGVCLGRWPIVLRPRKRST